MLGFLSSANFATASQVSDDLTLKSIEVKSGDKKLKVTTNNLKFTSIEQIAQPICSIDGEKCTITIEFTFEIPKIGSVTASVQTEGNTCKEAARLAADGAKDLRDYLWNTFVKNH